MQKTLEGSCGPQNSSPPKIPIYDLGPNKGTRASNQLFLEAEGCPRQSGNLGDEEATRQESRDLTKTEGQRVTVSERP